MALPLNPPIKPMLAALVQDLPRGADFFFEPKWDGFRCLVFAEPNSVYLQSRTGRSFNRYFPEILSAVEQGTARPMVLDGELIVARQEGEGQRLDWDALSERIHPAASRVRMLAERTPAMFIAFDLLALDTRDLSETAFATRRDLLEDLEFGDDRLHTTPVTDVPETALEWFRVFEGAGLDGVIAKRGTDSYQPGRRTMFKVKHSRTADCVVAGLRWHANTEPGTAVGSLLLGLYHDGVLHHVGVVGAFPAAKRRELAATLTELRTGGDHPWLGPQAEDGRRLPGSVNRWSSGEQTWEPLRPEKVVEVSYDHTEGAFPYRFRHTTQFRRWRPDRDPASCGYDQLEEVARYDLDAVLRGEVLPGVRRDK